MEVLESFSFLAGSISTDNLLNYSHEINSISNSLGPNGNIHLYGCNVGKGDKGLDFINLFLQFQIWVLLLQMMFQDQNF